MAMWGSRKKSVEPVTKGGRGSNQYMLKPQSGDYDANLDASRSEVIRSLIDSEHKSASRGSDNALSETIYEMSDALGDGNDAKAFEAESRIRASLPDYVGSRVTNSVRADHQNVKTNESEDRIRYGVTVSTVSAESISHDIASSKHSYSDEPLTNEEEADIKDTSDIESMLIKPDQNSNPRAEMSRLSERVNSLSNRRILSVGF